MWFQKPKASFRRKNMTYTSGKGVYDTSSSIVDAHGCMLGCSVEIIDVANTHLDPTKVVDVSVITIVLFLVAQHKAADPADAVCVI
jgi:hypothetical protein